MDYYHSTPRHLQFTVVAAQVHRQQETAERRVDAQVHVWAGVDGEQYEGVQTPS